MSMIVNRRDIDFYLYELLDLEGLLKNDRYQEHDRDTVTAILDLAQQIAEEAFLPCAADLDEHEPIFEAGRVVTPDSLKACLKTFVEAGLPAATFDTSLGVLGWIGQVQPTFMPLMDESVRMVGPVG